jgi:hypothetical protein
MGGNGLEIFFSFIFVQFYLVSKKLISFNFLSIGLEN